MKPADGGMASLVQRIARQALVTFRSPPRPGEEAGRSFLENHARLRALMTEVRAADLRLAPRRPEPRPPHLPPVTYMHICETEVFSMGVFLLRAGACIPLHDHPGMHGVLKVLYGKVRISCFDRLDGGAPPPAGHRGALWRSVLRSAGDFTELSAPCVLAPARENLHRIQAPDGPSAFMDILAPPYHPEAGRDCHYYRVLGGAPDQDQDQDQEDQEVQEDQDVWLLEVSQPPGFWCGGEPYPGPEVRL